MATMFSVEQDKIMHCFIEPHKHHFYKTLFKLALFFQRRT